MYYYRHRSGTIEKYTKKALLGNFFPEVIAHDIRDEGESHFSLFADEETQQIYMSGESKGMFYLQPVNGGSDEGISVIKRENERSFIKGLYAHDGVFYIGLKIALGHHQSDNWLIKIDGGKYTRSERYGALPIYLGRADDNLFFWH